MTREIYYSNIRFFRAQQAPGVKTIFFVVACDFQIEIRFDGEINYRKDGTQRAITIRTDKGGLGNDPGEAVTIRRYKSDYDRDVNPGTAYVIRIDRRLFSDWINFARNFGASSEFAARASARTTPCKNLRTNQLDRALSRIYATTEIAM